MGRLTWIRLDCDADTQPRQVLAGFEGTTTWKMLAGISGQYGLEGELPAEYADAVYVANRCAAPVEFVTRGIDACLRAGLLIREGKALRFPAADWDAFRNPDAVKKAETRAAERAAARAAERESVRDSPGQSGTVRDDPGLSGDGTGPDATTRTPTGVGDARTHEGTAGAMGSPETGSADAATSVTLNRSTWQLQGLPRDVLNRWVVRYGAAAVDATIADCIGLAQVDDTYPKAGNWTRAIHSRLRLDASQARQGKRPPPLLTYTNPPPEPPPPPEPLGPLTAPSVDWPKVIEVLGERINGDTERWIVPLNYLGDSGDSVVLEAPDEFHARWVRDNLLDVLRDTIAMVAEHYIGVHMVLAGGAS